jgi:hypothetical protein
MAAWTATQAQAYSVAVSLDGQLLAQSPHTLLVKPAAICGAMSTADGAGISLATVAPRVSAFTIQAVGSSRVKHAPVKHAPVPSCRPAAVCYPPAPSLVPLVPRPSP